MRKKPWLSERFITEPSHVSVNATASKLGLTCEKEELWCSSCRYLLSSSDTAFGDFRREKQKSALVLFRYSVVMKYCLQKTFFFKQTRIINTFLIKVTTVGGLKLCAGSQLIKLLVMELGCQVWFNSISVKDGYMEKKDALSFLRLRHIAILY